MTVEELFKPRYKVIADYPLSIFTIGDILYFHKNDGGWGNEGCYSNSPNFPNPNHRLFPPGSIEKYPHLFKPLEWWEERKESDMPEYVKDSEAGKYFFKVLQYWGKDNEYFRQSPDYSFEQLCTNHFLPATKEEYEKQKTIE